MAQFHAPVFDFVQLLNSFHNFFWTSNFFILSTTEEILLVETLIWGIEIGIVSLLHLYRFLLITTIHIPQWDSNPQRKESRDEDSHFMNVKSGLCYFLCLYPDLP
jgi:hypothetical protein